MSSPKTNVLPFLVTVVLGLSLAACSEQGEPPLRDGLYLKYTFTQSGPCRLTFAQRDTGRFQVTKTPHDCPFRADGFRSDTELLVDGYLHSNNGALYWGELSGEFGLLWLPGRLRTPGSSLGGGFSVVETKRWKQWEAVVVHATAGILESHSYYDAATGFLVGYEKTFGGERTLLFTLEDTNAAR